MFCLISPYSGLSQRQIALKLNRPVCVISNYLRLNENYEKLASPGRPTVLSETAKRHVIRECTNKITTVSTIKGKLSLDYSIRTVQRVIAAAPLIKRKILKRKPMLKPAHISGRLSFAKKQMTWGEKVAKFHLKR